MICNVYLHDLNTVPSKVDAIMEAPVAAVTVLEVSCLDPPVPKSIIGTESISVVSS